MLEIRLISILRIFNNGPGGADTSRAGIYLGSTPTSLDTYIDDDRTPQLLAGEYEDDNVSYQFQTSDIGERYIIVKSDYEYDLSEEIEDNNVSYIGPFNIVALDFPPSISGLPDKTISEDNYLNNAIDLWSFANDQETVDSDLVFIIFNSPDPNVGVRIDQNRYIDIDPFPNWSGETDVEIKVIDPQGKSDTDTFRVTVTAVNDDPWISPVVPDQNASEGENISIDLTPHEHDVEDSGTDLDWTVTGEDYVSTSGENSNDNVLTFVPNQGFSGSDSVTLHLKDLGGLEATQDILLVWKPKSRIFIPMFFRDYNPSANHSPYEPMPISPLDGSADQPVDTDLNWIGGDPDGDIVTYDVFFGNVNPPSQVTSDQSSTIYDPGELSECETYYWKIIATDEHDVSTPGPVWSFDTVCFGSITNGLYSYFPLSDKNDHFGYATTGEALNVGYATGLISNALSITADETNGMIFFGESLGDHDNTYKDVLYNDTTINAWINVESFDALTDGVMNIISGSPHVTNGCDGSINHWSLQIANVPGCPNCAVSSGSEKIVFDAFSFDENGSYEALNTVKLEASEGQLSTNTWYMISVTHDQATNTWKIFVNGSLVDSVTKTNGIGLGAQTRACPYAIGDRPYGDYGYPFSGEIDELGFWNRVLSDSEITQLYNDGQGLSLSVDNRSPEEPALVSPADGGHGQPTDTNVTWSGGDLDGDTVNYDIYFGTSNSPPLISQDQSSTTYDPGELSECETYYWMIIATDEHDSSTPGPVWSFDTVCFGSITNGLYSYFPLSDKNDHFGYATTGEALNVGYATGLISNALSITADEENGMIFFGKSLGDHDNTYKDVLYNDTTINAWINVKSFDALTDGVMNIISGSPHVTDGCDGSINHWSLQIENVPGCPNCAVSSGSEKIVFDAFSFDENGNYELVNTVGLEASEGQLSTNTWYMISVTHDQATHTWKIFVNGNLVDSVTKTDGIGQGAQTRACPYAIGDRPLGSSGYPFSGEIDELGFWNQVLADDEVITLYNDGSGIALLQFLPRPAMSALVPGGFYRTFSPLLEHARPD